MSIFPRRMFLRTSALAAMLLLAGSVRAGGLNLAWDNCASDGGLQARVSECLTNAGNNVLVGSFVPDADIAVVTGGECVLDVIVGDGFSPIPPWWDMIGTGACRASFGPPATLSANPVAPDLAFYCVDWASGAAAGGLAAYTTFGGSVAPVNQPAHRRVVLGFAVTIPEGADLVATQEYFAFNLVIRNYKTVGTGACAGCLEPAGIVLNQINIVPGINPAQVVRMGTSAGSNFATWQTSAPDCHLVPTRRTTWSAVKQLYL